MAYENIFSFLNMVHAFYQGCRWSIWQETSNKGRGVLPKIGNL